MNGSFKYLKMCVSNFLIYYVGLHYGQSSQGRNSIDKYFGEEDCIFGLH